MSDNSYKLKLSIILTFLFFATLTTLHDPIGHGLAAYLFGWEIIEWSTGVLSGYTTVAVESATLGQVWVFYMLPSISLYLLSYGTLLYYANKITAIFSTILCFLNLASLYPWINGTDAFKAMNLLIEYGFDANIAVIMHGFICLSGFLILAIVFFITHDNSDADMKSRAKFIRKKI